MTDQIRVHDLQPGEKIERFFMARRVDRREFSRGTYLSVELGDFSGRIPAVMWEPDDFAMRILSEGMVVKVRGQIGEYNGKQQLIISRLREAEPKEYTIEQIVPHSPQTKEQRRARILHATSLIENSHIRLLVESFWQDESFFDQFLIAPAGKLWHHAYLGGLSEHSANVAELAQRAASGYDWLNLDYLIFGGLLHDVGKVDSYTHDLLLDFTDEGRLIGHIVIADQWLTERAAKIPDFPPSLLTKLRHMLLSHQGELAQASPVVPQMPEAFVLYYCDELDAKLGAIDRLRQRPTNRGWSEFVKLLDRYLYFESTEPQEPPAS